jgi:group II intron reverse transcriptase/maturase
MPNEKANVTSKQLSVDSIRHAEYYGMQETFDSLYARSKNGDVFDDLMDIVLSRENILLAYRNMKSNTGSRTAGTDKLNIFDISTLTADEVVAKVRFILTESNHGYRPKPVRRKEIPKPYDPTKTRPLGIPCIWDRLVQQCIKQVMEPICEAKFSDNSYGFRPNRSVENAIAATYYRLNIGHLNYVIEFDIKGFFDNVNHSKLIKQIWSLGIRDTRLIGIVKRILTAPIKMPDGSVVRPDKGTPQGGIISPLLANIVLNELDHWVDSQWLENPVLYKYSGGFNKSGTRIKSTGYRAMRNTNLKEMYIVRYADDFRIFCRTKEDAKRTMIAVTQWLSDRLKLEVSPEKTRIVNVKHRYSDFLGFKIKLHQKGKKYVVKSRIADKQRQRKKQNLIEQAKYVAHPRKGRNEYSEITLYNSMVMGMQNYYNIATDIIIDCSELNRAVMTVLTNRLKEQRSSRLVKTGRALTKTEQKRYGKSQQLRYVAGVDEPIYPIGYTQFRTPRQNNRNINSFSVKGRVGLHDNLRINTDLMLMLMRNPPMNASIEYADNRISLFSAQWGKCAVTGKEFQGLQDIYCHHINPYLRYGRDRYANLILICENVYNLITAVDPRAIKQYLLICNLNDEQIDKVNVLRKKSGLETI